MADPERLLERSARGSALSQLLQAAADERPSPNALQRTLTAVGVTSALVGAAGTAQAAAAGAGASAGVGAAGSAVGKASGGLLLMKWVGAGVLAGGLTTGLAQVATEGSPSPSPSSSATASSRLRPTTPAPPSQAAVPVPPRPPATAQGPTATPASAKAESQLSVELALLGRVKALSASNPGLALRELEAYRAKFPQGKMSYEGSVIGMQTAERAGQLDLARRYAREVLAIQPQGPRAEQARILLVR